MEACEKPKDWLDAFFLLEKHLQKIDDGSRQLVFLDELPWLDTARSGFVRAFEGFWNTWGCHRDNLMVVVCFNHVPEIKRALGVSGVISESSAWSKRSDDETGTQIDLLLSRNDNVINMCECKFYSDDFSVDGKYYRTILRRQEMLAGMVSRKIAIHSTLITTYGLIHNEYSGAFMANVV